MSILAQLISDHETAAQQAAAQLKQKREEALEKLRASLEEAFGALADEMGGEVESVEWGRDDKCVIASAAVRIQHQDWKESGYYRYAVYYQGGYSSAGWRLSSGPHISYDNGVPLTGAITPAVVEFMAEGQKKHEEQLAKNRQQAEKKHNDAIEDAYRKLFYASREDAADSLNKLLELAPEREEKWRKQYEVRIAELDQVKAEEEAKEAAMDRYRQALREWKVESDRITAANRAKVLAIQKEFDREFTVWELEYGVAGEDEDGCCDHWRETVKVLSNEPDEQGYWPTIRYGRVERKKFYHPSALGVPQTYRPTEYTSLVCSRTPADSFHTEIHFLEEDEEAVMERLATLEKVPPKPNAAAFGLDSWDNAVRRLEEAILSEDLPF